MSIKICDAIMGSGKSSAAINYMNAHPDKKFIYITPYLQEVERIKNACPALHFHAPSNTLPEYNFRKYDHTIELVHSGVNIVSTHNMFMRYTTDMIEDIRRYNYTLILDEDADVIQKAPMRRSDLRLLEQAGWIQKDDDGYHVTDKCEFDGRTFNTIVALSKGNRIINLDACLSDNRKKEIVDCFYWVYTKEIFEAFEDVYVLTYLFDADKIHHFFCLNNMPFEYINVRKDKSGSYEFCVGQGDLPDYLDGLSKKIHVFENDKLNAIGYNKNALSSTWYKRYSKDSPQKQTLRKHLQNYFMNYNKGKGINHRLWATYKTGESVVRNKGYFYNNLAFNARATNEFRDRDVLAYCVNVFMHPEAKKYFIQQGVAVDEDKYALSIMIQWIWRSAIRDGHEIWIYLPSKRMRNILYQWIDEVEQQYKEWKGDYVA